MEGGGKRDATATTKKIIKIDNKFFSIYFFTAWRAKGATATTVCASTATEFTTGSIPDVITKYTTFKTASNIYDVNPIVIIILHKICSAVTATMLGR